ncbi:MAG: thioredoxin family protein [Methanophagales archaeon]|nr:thioredoxin family protein [Methanophagales archaeon]
MVKIRGKDIIAFVFAVMLIAMCSDAVNAQSAIQWHNYQEGMQIAGYQDKPTMIFFESERCPACKMQKEVLADTLVINMSKNFVPIIGSGELARGYGIRYIPTIVFTNSQGEEVYRLVGYHDAETLIEEMQYAIRLSSSPMQPPFQDPYAHDTETPGFDVIVAIAAVFICVRRRWLLRRGCVK